MGWIWELKKRLSIELWGMWKSFHLFRGKINISVMWKSFYLFSGKINISVTDKVFEKLFTVQFIVIVTLHACLVVLSSAPVCEVHLSLTVECWLTGRHACFLCCPSLAPLIIHLKCFMLTIYFLLMIVIGSVKLGTPKVSLVYSMWNVSFLLSLWQEL